MYSKKLLVKMKCVEKINKESIEIASNFLMQTIKNNGIIYIFGSGHSHIMAEEMFCRPGGLFNVYPIFYEPLMVHNGPIKSAAYEKQRNYHQNFINKYKMNENDALILISTSGINSVPIEIAMYAKKRRTKIIVISSSKYYKKVPTSHKDNIYLVDLSDVFIDNQINIGDNALRNEKTKIEFGSFSTIIGIFIVNLLSTTTIEKLLNENFDVPIVLSPNIEGSKEKNKKNVSKYNKVIKCLQ